MPAIGSGALPDPNTVDASVYDGWLVVSNDDEVKDKYYELIGTPPDQYWLLSIANIIESTDPIISPSGQIYRLDDLSFDTELNQLPALPD